MKKLNQRGELNVLLIPLIFTIILLAGTVAFGVWSFEGRKDYKENVDKKIEAAVAVAQTNTATQKDNEFKEEEKKPFDQYQGPVQFGAITVKYPKTWSTYVDEKGNGTIALDVYLHPKFVPGVQTGLNYATRIQVTNRSYDQELKQFDSFVKAGKVTVNPYTLKLQPNIIGSRLDGEIISQKRGSIVLLPLRDKTIKLWTEDPSFTNDFNTIILDNFTFSP